jgi:exopolyphosphatase/guanosine-5'-triphosphate,3'-diphosphate pyrophosphatase
VQVGLVDIGSNTARLLVATRSGDRLVPVREERALLALGEEIARFGRISEHKLAETVKTARRYTAAARKLGCDRLRVLVTAPGRSSANAGELVQRLSVATGVRVQVLSEVDEGALAFAGAVATSVRRLPAVVAVCDVGGGSSELAVGQPTSGPSWVRSLPVGSLELTVRLLPDDPPGGYAVAVARYDVEQRFDGLAPPYPRAGLATGGSARALAKLVGRILDEESLATALRLLTARPSASVAKLYGIDRGRARTLTAGALLLAEAQRRLGVPFEVARGGLREGAALELLDDLAAA